MTLSTERPQQGMTGASDAYVVRVQGLEVSYAVGHGSARVLRGVDFSVRPGEIVAVIGESGSGKSTLGMTLLGLLPERPTPRIDGAIEVAGTDLRHAGDRELRALRRRDLGVVLQDPTRALNPTMRIGTQLRERGATHEDTLDWLARCEVPAPERRVRQFAMELSGGLAQRVTIAMALATGRRGEDGRGAQAPRLLVADEPTTALDPTTKLEVLRLFEGLRADHGCAVVMITHDISAAARIADRLVVLYAGRVCEEGPTAEVLARPRHPYTAALAASLPSLADRSLPAAIAGGPPSVFDEIRGCAFAPRCSRALPTCSESVPTLTPVDGMPRRTLACFHPIDQAGAGSGPVTGGAPAAPSFSDRPVALRATGVGHSFGKGDRLHRALCDVSVTVRAGQSVLIVGESGCGKTTLLRMLAGLERPDSGEIWSATDRAPQLIHQNYTAALTPWLTIGSQIAERLRERGVPRKERKDQIERLLDDVGLDPGLADRRALQLSGGQRQRAVLARALASEPAALLCDEPTSSLDASYAVRVVQLLRRVQESRDIGLVVVTHDMWLARGLADHVVVMKDGRIVEEGDPSSILERPQHPYTRSLLEAGEVRIRQFPQIGQQ